MKYVILWVPEKYRTKAVQDFSVLGVQLLSSVKMSFNCHLDTSWSHLGRVLVMGCLDLVSCLGGVILILVTKMGKT